VSQIDEDELSVEQTRDAIRALKELRSHPGWDIIRRIVNSQITSRIDSYILQPRKDMASEWEKEFQKGEVAGMRFILALPEQELDTLEALKEVEDARTDTSSEDYPGDADGGDSEHAEREPSFPAARTQSGIVHTHKFPAGS
jgi:hypothetical protein